MPITRLHLILLSFSLSFLFAANCPPLVLASETQDAEGSLDTIWKDNVSENKTENKSATNVPNLTKGLCQLDTFLKSEFMTSTPWEGVGPFQVDSGNAMQFVDSSHNSLSLTVSGERVAQAQLELSNKLGTGARFINLEMAADFFLEALGGKPGLIHELNAQMEKNAEPLGGSAPATINLNAGPYRLEIGNLGNVSEVAEAKPAFRIHVAGNVADKEPTQEAVTTNGQPAGVENGNELSTTQSTTIASAGEITPTKEEISNSNANVASKSNSDSHSPEVVKDAEAASSQIVGAVDKDAALKDELLEVIKSWQRLKKTAVLQRKTNDLSKILAGRALVRQTDAINWLVANHKYYDMTLKAASIDRFSELIPNKKYAVYARVKESTKYIDDTNGQVIKDSEDTYDVNYTIEKAADHWLITDSAILKSPSTGQNQTGKKTR